MNILIINGPNINRLGSRQPDIYGTENYQALEACIHAHAKKEGLRCTIHQTNFEGIIIDLLHHAESHPFQGVLLNAGALTHYSYAIYDAILSIDIPVVEVHLSDPDNREETFRKQNVIRAACQATFKGHGFKSYLAALDYLKKEVIL